VITATQEAIAALIRRDGPMTINEVTDRTNYCHATVRRVLRGQQFAVVGRQAGQGPGAHVFDLVERANRTPEDRPNPIVEQHLLDQETIVKAIRTLARRRYPQAAIHLAEVWLAEDSAFKRMVGGAA
jgi:predicted ArsR family transcriptional regulator